MLAGPVRPLNPHFDAPGVRMTEADLLAYANSTGRRIPPAVQPPKGTPSTEFSLAAIAAANAAAANSASASGGDQRSQTRRSSRATTRRQRKSADGQLPAAATRAFRRAMTPLSAAARGEIRSSGRLLSFCAKEGAALVLTASPQGDGGTVFVAAHRSRAATAGPWRAAALVGRRAADARSGLRRRRRLQPPGPHDPARRGPEDGRRSRSAIHADRHGQ